MIHRSFALVLLALGVSLALTPMPAQEQQPTPPPQAPQPAPTPTPSPEPGGRTPTIPTPTPTPTPRQPQPEPDFTRERQTFPEMQRPIFLSGKVVLEDGTPPPDPVVIERVCNGQPRPEAYTDSKGRFSFQLGQNTSLIADASVNTAADFPADSRSGGSSSSPFGRMRTFSERDLIGCELRASLPGYRSDVVPLAGRRLMDNPDVGTIVLRRLGHVEGTTISATTLAAPKDARKAYEKGREAARKKKFDEALKHFQKAVQLYPQYAAAWYELGFIHQQQNRKEQAREAYAKSLEADAKYTKPYLQLALLAAQDRNWQEVADTTDRLLRLDAFDYPQAYFFNSVANFNLRKLDAAERSVREGLKLDTQNRIPKMKHLLGVILANKQDYVGAAEQLRAYLPHAANEQEAELVRKQLAEVERFAGLSAVPPAGQPKPE